MKSRRKIWFLILPAMIIVLEIIVFIVISIKFHWLIAAVVFLGGALGVYFFPTEVYEKLVDIYFKKIIKKYKKEQVPKKNSDIPIEESNLHISKLNIHVNPLLKDAGSLLRLSDDELKKHVESEYKKDIMKNYSNISFEEPEVYDAVIPLYNLFGDQYYSKNSIKWQAGFAVGVISPKEIISTQFYFSGELSVGDSKKPRYYFIYIDSAKRSYALIYTKAINKINISVSFYGAKTNSDNEAKNTFIKLLEQSGKERFSGLIDVIKNQKDIDINSLQEILFAEEREKKVDAKILFGPVIEKKIKMTGENYTVCAMECSRYVYTVKSQLYSFAKQGIETDKVDSQLAESIAANDYKTLLSLGKHALYATAAGLCSMDKLNYYIEKTKDNNEVSWCEAEMKKVICNFYEESKESAAKASEDDFILINLIS